jgi:hypothetical protein
VFKVASQNLIYGPKARRVQTDAGRKVYWPPASYPIRENPEQADLEISGILDGKVHVNNGKRLNVVASGEDVMTQPAAWDSREYIEALPSSRSHVDFNAAYLSDALSALFPFPSVQRTAHAPLHAPIPQCALQQLDKFRHSRPTRDLAALGTTTI